MSFFFWLKLSVLRKQKYVYVHMVGLVIGFMQTWKAMTYVHGESETTSYGWVWNVILTVSNNWLLES